MSLKRAGLGRTPVFVTAALLQTVPALGQTPLFPDVSIAGSKAECVRVSLVAGFVEYRYRITNPPSSDAGVKSLSLDISAPLGMSPPMLPTTGVFIGDVTRVPSKATAGHVPVGMDLPPKWRGIILRDGSIRWRAPGEGLKSLDPVRPGGSREDVVLRSTYLPGVRKFELLPDYPHVCCPYSVGDPRNDTIKVKTPEDFKVVGNTIGPTYAPAAVVLSLVRSLLDEACRLHWVTNPGVCNSLQVKLDHAQTSLGRGQVQSARGELQAFLNELTAQHGAEPGKHVTDNAYWLLKTNAEFVLSKL